MGLPVGIWMASAAVHCAAGLVMSFITFGTVRDSSNIREVARVPVIRIPLTSVKEPEIEKTPQIELPPDSTGMDEPQPDVPEDAELNEKPKDVIETLSTVIVAPEYAENPPPRYPRLARRLGHEGLVMLNVRVSAEGLCISVTVTRSSGHTILDREAVRAVKGWRFKPAMKAGVPVEGEMQIPIRFLLRP